jgi:hypothetical protein
MRFVNAASNQEKKEFLKTVRSIISRIPRGFTVAVADESIFMHESLVRLKEGVTAERVRPIVTMTGRIKGAVC